MKQYETFIFDSFDFDPETGRIALRYSLDDEVKFEEIIEIPVQNMKINAMHQTLFALHMAAGVSYYKTCCPKKIEIRSGHLNTDQAAFWKSVYENGLGEFFYKNTIDFRDLLRFPESEPGTPVFHQSDRPANRRVLVPVGGGKDSIVTIERLKAEGKDCTLLRIGTHPLIEAVVNISGVPCIYVQRKLPKTLFELNEAGALNGHVPITAFVSCLAVVVAEAVGFDSVVMSNEKSANIGNVEYLGKEINHQWSKSAEFETAFDRYIRTYINQNLHYYSPLREMTELEVVKEFVSYPQYFECFSSCNKNWKIAGVKQSERWCGTCPKCAFVFCLMAAYLPKEEVLRIFGKNMLENTELVPLFKELLGLEGFKPFECVGTPEETREAFAMIRKRGDFADAPVLNALP